jgi:low affinity Fe/Cu permease
MANGKQKNWLERIGGEISAVASDISAHPFAQIGIILFCAAWWLIGLPTDILTAALSILAITLTQMVLNRQKERELDAHRRDVAMHAKLDELVIATRRARNEVAGIEEEMDEEDIEELKHHALEAIEAASEEGATEEERKSARKQIEEAEERLTKER